MVAMILIMLAMFWFMRKRLMILLTLPVFIIALMIPAVHDRVQDALERGYAVGQRQETAEISLQVIKDNLFFGLGKRTVLAAMELQYGPVKGKDRRIIYEHNMVLSMLLEDGIIGFSLFLLLCIIYIYVIMNNIYNLTNPFFHNILVACLLGFLGFMLTTLTGGTIGENIFWYQIGLSMAIIKLGHNYQYVSISDY